MSGFVIIFSTLALLVVIFGAAGLKIVQQSEVVIIERLGKYSRTLRGEMDNGDFKTIDSRAASYTTQKNTNQTYVFKTPKITSWVHTGPKFCPDPSHAFLSATCDRKQQTRTSRRPRSRPEDYQTIFETLRHKITKNRSKL